MSEEPPVVKTGDEARQGVRVKGMTTVLMLSIIFAVVAITIIAVFVAVNTNAGG